MRSAHNSEGIYERLDQALTGPFQGLPLLTIFGERNDPLGFQPRWKKLFPDAHQIVVSKGNHFPMCDDPDLVAASIREFTRSN
jgi:haloalkane dehalogenase